MEPRGEQLQVRRFFVQDLHIVQDLRITINDTENDAIAKKKREALEGETQA